MDQNTRVIRLIFVISGAGGSSNWGARRVVLENGLAMQLPLFRTWIVAV
jgi:hypothetical protein